MACRGTGRGGVGEDILLITRADVLSPGPWAAERGSAGRWAYRLPETPFVLVSESGREKRLGFVEPDLEGVVLSGDGWHGGVRE